MTAGQPLRVYLDNNVVQLLADYDRAGTMTLVGREAEVSALVELRGWPKLEMIASRKTGQELSRDPDPERRARHLAFSDRLRLISEKVARFRVLPGIMVNRAAWSPVEPPVSNVRFIPPSAVAEPLWGQLLNIFKPDDAEHIYIAVNTGCDYFVTVDFASILNRASAKRSEIEAICKGTRLVSPSQLLVELKR